MSTTKMKAPGKKDINGTNGKEATPVMHQRGREIQRYGTVTAMPVGVATEARQTNCTMLNQLLADTIALYSLYKKAHWQVKGALPHSRCIKIGEPPVTATSFSVGTDAHTPLSRLTRVSLRPVAEKRAFGIIESAGEP